MSLYKNTCSNILAVTLSLLFCVASFTSYAGVILTWDWNQPVNNVDSNTPIEMWATLSHDAASTNDLPFGLMSVSIIPSTLIDNGAFTSGNPYLFELNPTIHADLDYSSSNPFKLGESVQFLYGTLTPKAGISSGTYSTTNIDLGFSSAIFTTVESDFIVNVTAIPAPIPVFGSPIVIIFLAGLLGLFGAYQIKHYSNI